MESSVILGCLLVLVCSLMPCGLCADKDQTPDFCKLSPDSNPTCMAYMPQYFYNSTSQECEEFIYGGCGGNQNRFGSKKKCLETCYRPAVTEKVNLDSTLLKYKGACNLPAESGPCMGYMPMYFYNGTSGQCEIFIYGGCKGNANRFKDSTSCQMYCRAVPPLNSTEVCNLPPKTGPCNALFHKLYYNPETQRCEPFIYGGCEGNANNFDSAEACQFVCHPDGSDVITPLVATGRAVDECSVAPEAGPCRMNLPRFFYNSTSQKCELFTYGGCDGNKNRFVSERECHLNCPFRGPRMRTVAQPESNVCLLPSDPGPCEAYIPRFYFNKITKKCEVFIYGGCQGNQNNFIDKAECLKKCKK
ncbi:unnamed protein product [Knipowitschia caucasica]